MARGFEIFDGLASQHPPIPEGSVVSRLILSNRDVKVVLVGFAPGESLSEPAPDQPAIIEVWRGEGLVTIAIEDSDQTKGKTASSAPWEDASNGPDAPDAGIEEVYELGPGTWLYLDAGTAHTIQSTTEMVLLLTLLKGESNDNA